LGVFLSRLFHSHMKQIVDNDISVLKDKTCLILMYFTATWCGPCQRIKPLLQKLSDGLDDEKVEVYMVDIDDNDDLAGDLKVKSVPTFYLFKDKDLLNQCSGADITKIHAMLKEHMD
jgi:thioredoxin-like negative regulator of GroEL